MQIERTSDPLEDCGPGYVHTRGRVHARPQGFSRFAFGLFSQSPTTIAETTRDVRCSRHEKDSMTRLQYLILI